MNILNLLIGLSLPVYLIQSTHPAANLYLLGFTMTVFLKLTSYAHVMSNIRHMFKRLE
jgi:flagellar biosynthesis protein FliR